MKLMEYLRTDEELKQLREEWKTKFTRSFPPYNYDEYGGIDDYKQRIKNALKSGDYKALGTGTSKFKNLTNKQK